MRSMQIHSTCDVSINSAFALWPKRTVETLIELAGRISTASRHSDIPIDNVALRYLIHFYITEASHLLL
jgi:hypothetical protein